MIDISERVGMSRLEVQSGCRICDAPERERLVGQSRRSVAFPSLGAFVEGWVLVAPRSHVVALSELARDEWQDLSEMLETCNRQIKAAYGPTVLFEHGAAGTSRTAGCGVDHAHMHIVPWNGDLREEIARVPDLGEFTWRNAEGQPRGDGGMDYIWLCDASGTWITYAPELPSQVIRRAIARELGLSWWDWKSDLRRETAEATADRLQRSA